MDQALLLASEAENELPLPPLGIGLIALGILLALLVITLIFGKGREHG